MKSCSQRMELFLSIINNRERDFYMKNLKVFERMANWPCLRMPSFVLDTVGSHLQQQSTDV